MGGAGPGIAPRGQDTAVSIAVFTVCLFVLVAAGIRLAVPLLSGPASDRPGESAVSASGAVGSGLQVSWQVEETRRLWARDNGVTDCAPRPPEEYALPTIPGGRCVWSDASEGVESWGFVTEHAALDVGLATLAYYRDVGGWELDSSETLDLSGAAWGGIVHCDDTQEVVIVVALPKNLSEAPSAANPTQVSVMRMAGEEVLRGVVSDFDTVGGQ